MKEKIAAIVNFIYFLANFPKPFNEIIDEIWAGQKLLADHLKSKIVLNTECVTPETIIKWFFKLDSTNQHTFLEWVEKNYHHSDGHNDQPWQISIPVPIQEVKDMIITALEGGSNYWYYLPDVEMARKEEFRGLALAEKIVNAVIDHGEVVPVHDLEDETEKLGEISRENIERGLKLYLPGNMLDGSADAGEADQLFQMIVMGEVIYG